MTENWLPIPDAPGYEVSDQGRVRSTERKVDRINGRSYRVRERTLKQTLTPGGHHRVSLHIGVGTVSRLVHQIVLETFIGARPVGYESCHYDDDKHNNSLSNLRWGTSSENAKDRVRNGLNQNSNKTHCLNGHPFSGGNLGGSPERRVCKLCARNRQRAYRSKKENS